MSYKICLVPLQEDLQNGKAPCDTISETGEKCMVVYEIGNDFYRVSPLVYPQPLTDDQEKAIVSARKRYAAIGAQYRSTQFTPYEAEILPDGQCVLCETD